MAVTALKKEQEDGVVHIDSGEDEEAEKVVKRRRKRKKKKAIDPRCTKRPCVDCTRRCARIHGRVSSSSSGNNNKARPVPAVPSFFKVMVGRFSESMDIPPPFAKTILDMAGSNIYLEDSFGLRWRVRLRLRGAVLSLGHGWNNFVLDHAVSCGEFLVFRQIARSVFTVQMFAPSAIERLYLCERNRRQSRKRKPRQKASSPRIQTGKIIKSNGGSCKRKRRADAQSEEVPDDCKMSAHLCIDDSDVSDSASELKCLGKSLKAPEAGESQEVSKALTTNQEGNVQRVLDGQTEIADSCKISTERPVSDATETEHVEDSSLPVNVDTSEPLAVLDLNEVSMDDIYLSADIYEFESDLCNQEAFSGDLNKEGPITNGQTSGFDCLGHDLANQHSSMKVCQGFGMSGVLPWIENKQTADAPETCTGAPNVPQCDIDLDINVIPPKEPLSLGEENSSPPLGECGLGSCNMDKCSFNKNQAVQKEDSSAMQGKPQEDQVNMQGSTEQHATEIMSSSSKPNELAENNSEDLQTGSTESGGVLALAANKFSVAVPPPGQTWLELPSRLPVIPRTKKQGRKVVVLKDPFNRLWPALYQCTPRFSGFITGWVEISRENSLREGDTCEFELSGKKEFSFQVRSGH